MNRETGVMNIELMSSPLQDEERAHLDNIKQGLEQERQKFTEATIKLGKERAGIEVNLFSLSAVLQIDQSASVTGRTSETVRRKTILASGKNAGRIPPHPSTASACHASNRPSSIPKEISSKVTGQGLCWQSWSKYQTENHTHRQEIPSIA